MRTYTAKECACWRKYPNYYYNKDGHNKPKPKKTVDEALTESLNDWDKAQKEGWYN